MIACFIEDNPYSLKHRLGEIKSHFQVDLFHDPRTFQDALSQNHYALILMDYAAAKKDNFHLLKSIHGCPIIVSSHGLCEEEKFHALSAGANDFYSHNMKSSELILRLKNNLKRYGGSQTLKLGTVRVVVSELNVYLSGNLIDVTLIELKILSLLVKKFPGLINQEELVNEVWPGQKILPATINTHLYNLRTKLKSWDHEIVTVKAKGYSLQLKTP